MGLEIINKLRKSKGMTSEQLSSKSGVPLGTLNKILSRVTKDPKLETLKALAKVLECRLDDFDEVTAEAHDIGSITLSPEEKDIIVKYRQLPDQLKEDIRDYMEMKYAKAMAAYAKK